MLRRLIVALLGLSVLGQTVSPAIAADPSLDAAERKYQAAEAELKRLRGELDKARADQEAATKAADEYLKKVLTPDEHATLKRNWAAFLALVSAGLTIKDAGLRLGLFFIAKMLATGELLDYLAIKPDEVIKLQALRKDVNDKKIAMLKAQLDATQLTATQEASNACIVRDTWAATQIATMVTAIGTPGGQSAPPKGGYLKVTVPADQYVQANTDVEFSMSVDGGTGPYQVRISSSAFADVDTTLDDASKGAFKQTFRFPQEGVYPVTVTVTDDAVPHQTEGKSVVYNVRTDPVPPKPVPPTGKPLTVSVPKDQDVEVNADVPFKVDVSDGAPPYEIHVRSLAFADIDGKLERSGASLERTVRFPLEGNYSILVDVTDSARQTKTATVTFAASAPQISALTIEPGAVTLKAGETRTFKALGLFADRAQASKDVTDQATWEGVEADKSFKAANPGTYTVAATYQGVRGQTTVTVTKPEPVAPPPTLTLKIDPDTVSLEVGETKQLKAVGTYSDRPDQTEDLSDSATWTGVGADRTFRADKPGQYQVTAVVKGVRAQVAITVTAPAAPPRAPLTARLECGGLVEIVPGEISKPCGVIVEGWRSDTTDRVEVVISPSPAPPGVQIFPGNTSADATNMHNAGVKTDAIDRYVFSQGFSAPAGAGAGQAALTVTVKQGATEIPLPLTVAVVPKGKPTGPMGATGTGVSSGSSGRLSAELDCGDSFELAPGDAAGRSCGIVVRGWNSTSATPVEVEVVWPRQSSGVDIFPGSTAADATVMYSAGVNDNSDRYVFGEGFTARADAPPGTTTVNITVRQRNVGSVALSVNVNVLKKGLLPSSGAGIRPPATVTGGTGGQFCVWRYKLFGDKPACFHFVAADCTTDRYNNAANGYEKVGDSMKWSEADARVQQLSTYFDNNYGCNVASTTPPPPPQTTPADNKPPDPPGPTTPDNTPPAAGTDTPPAPTGPFLSRFGVMCTPSDVTLGGSGTPTPSVRCQAFGVYSDNPNTTLDVTNRAAWTKGPTFTPDAPGALVIQASLDGASESATVTVKSGYDASKDPRSSGGGRAGAPILPPPDAPPGGPQNPNNPPGGLGGGPVVALTPTDPKNPNPGGPGSNAGPGGPGVPGAPGVPGVPGIPGVPGVPGVPGGPGVQGQQPCWNQQTQRWEYCPPQQGGVGTQPGQTNNPGRGGNRGGSDGGNPNGGTGSGTGSQGTGRTGVPPLIAGGGVVTAPSTPPAKQPPPTTTQPSTPPPPKAPPSPLPPTAAAAGAKCDAPLCRQMCEINCNASNTIGFVNSCADTCKPMSACPQSTYKLAEVKAACYDNILTRCRQGQAGWGGEWCVGPGADKTCEARAMQVCKCGTKAACRGDWSTELDDAPTRFASDADADVPSDVACMAPPLAPRDERLEDAIGFVDPDGMPRLMLAQHAD